MRAVRDIGDEVARSIREYFAEPRNRKAVERLMKHLDLKPLQAPSTQGRGALRDKSFVLTGTLETMTREEAEQKILRRRRTRDLRGQPQDRLRGGRRGGRAPSCARRPNLGCKTLDERAFVAMLGGKGRR